MKQIESRLELYKKYLLENKKKYSNELLMPEIHKIVISSAVDSTKMNSKEILPIIYEVLYKISGQKPTSCFARKSISQFKIRSGALVGFKVTLRKKYMFNFLDKLICVYLPNIREFRGLSKKSFNNDGITIGIQSLSCLVDLETKLQSLNIGFSINISLRRKDKTSFITSEEKEKILSFLNLPFNF